MARTVKLSDFEAWRRHLQTLEVAETESANVSEAGYLLTLLVQYGEWAGALIPTTGAPTDALGSATGMRLDWARNPDLDWKRGEIDLDVEREANDPPPDWLIDRIVTVTGIPESGE